MCYILITEVFFMDNYRLPEPTHIGYVHLRVANLDRALAFYRDRLGFREIARQESAVSLSANGESPPRVILTGHPGAVRKPPHTTGLYHVAIRLPDRPALARVFRRLIESQWPLQGAADHLVSEALYLPDADGNGIELYVDRPRDQWLRSGGQMDMATKALDVEGLLAQAGNAAWDGIDPRTDIGHVHLHVGDLARAEAFYSDLLGFEVMQRSYPGALFVAAGGYHHHLGLNIWAGRGAPPPPPDAVGLIAFAIALPDEDSRHLLIARVKSAGVAVEESESSALLRDPDGIEVALVAE
jgi:catechol 2,3-dioxygenase